MKLREFVEILDKEGKLKHIKEKVSVDYEIAKYLKKFDGTPLIFENVVNRKNESSIPVVGNLVSSMDLLCEGLGIKKEDFIKTIVNAIENPKEYKKAERNEFIYLEPDLSMLPILKHYPLDQGPYITSGVVFANYKGIKNTSFHRLCLIGNDRLVGRLIEKGDLYKIYQTAKQNGEDVDVSITIGNSVGVLIGGATPVAYGIYELGIASALENGIEVVNAKTNSSEYPADSEIVLEGKILHDETTKEGPFVDITATYDIVREQPVFVIDKIAIKKQAIYQALLPAGNEHKLLMGGLRIPTIYKAIKEAGVDVVGIYLTPGGSGWLDVVVAIKKKSEEDAKKAIEATIKGHQSVKKITIVDDDIDITNPEDVNYAITMYWSAGKEIVFDNVKGSTLDPMATPDGIGSKIAIDATRPLNIPKEKILKFKKVV
jgi:4-hydroxy-3-polyprenylbenzoate decarboxylase